METSEEVVILGSILMDNLSRDSAEKHYEKLLKLHYTDFLTLAQKVDIFQHDLEHEILKEITGEKEYFTQLNWLKNNQITVIRGQKTGRIPPVLVSDIENLKKWRNEAQHENNMPILKYKSHLYTMAETIRFFSNIEWSVEMSNILNDIEIAGNRYEVKVEEIKINEGEVPQMVENKEDKPKENDNNKKPKVNNKNDKSDYYFVNTGINDDRPSRDWNNNIKYHYISAGNDIRYIERIRTLKKGDKIFAYTPQIGYVGWGIVEEEAVLVKNYFTDKKNNIKMIDNFPEDHEWKKQKAQDIDEWIVRVDWKKTVKEEEAVPNKDSPFPYINNVCRLKTETLEYLKDEFGIKRE